MGFTQLCFCDWSRKLVPSSQSKNNHDLVIHMLQAVWLFSLSFHWLIFCLVTGITLVLAFGCSIENCSTSWELTLQLSDQICNSCYCQSYNSFKVSSENLVNCQYQLIIPKFILSFFLITYLIDIVSTL